MPHKRNHCVKAPLSRSRGITFLVGTALLAALLVFIIQPAQALAYFFAVPVSTVDVYANADGTVSLDYYYLFDNQARGDPIEYVDIGMPTTDYDRNSVTATIDGNPVFRVEDSTEVNGIALNLGSQAIPPGQQGEVRAFIPTVNGMLFKANTQEAEPYASFQFEPNFFGQQYITGRTDLTVTLHLPPGLTTEEPRWFPAKNWPGSEDPETGVDENGNVTYRWRAENANLASQYVFGAAFPARLVPEAALLTEVPFTLNFESLCPAIICLGFVGFVIFTIWAAITGERKRRLQYLPPRVAVEGNGIKRGLTAVEAALLMQQPMDKILTMILFSVVKKGAARVTSRDPMKLEMTQPAPEGLHDYEAQFLEAMAQPQVGVQRRGLQEMMTKLVRSTSEKMRGFSRKETLVYYEDIMRKAWQQVEQAQTPEMKMQSFDDAMDWTMLDRKFDDRTRDVFGPRPVILPTWWWRYDPTIAGSGMPGPAAQAPSIPSATGNRPPQGVSLPNLPGGDFAASMVGGMQAFASNVVGDLTAFTGGVTEKTNPVPKTTTTTTRGGGGGGGGRSCACACACAGCACACAGGGR